MRQCWKRRPTNTKNGYQQKHSRSLKKIQERRTRKADLCNSKTRVSKAMAQGKYTNANKEVKKSVRADKRNYIDNLAKEAEDAATEGNMRDLF